MGEQGDQRNSGRAARDKPPTTAATEADASQDVVLLHGPTEDGRALQGLRLRRGSLELAKLSPVQEGKPLLGAGEVVRLKEREGSPVLWDVEVQYDPARDRGPGWAASAEHAGPPRVASPIYRQNWDAIFGDQDPDDRGDRSDLN